MRFSALDALRGICALLVILSHIEGIGNIYAGSMHGEPFFEHGFLFVDFFFVLSGFVLTYAYYSKITTANELGVFIIRRFGRVYPLHLFFLIFFIALEFAKLYADSKGVHANHAPFTNNYSIPSIFTNILLVQAFNFHSVATWNSPSWSISVEFYTYIVFAIFAIFLRGSTRFFIVASACIAAFGAYMVYNFSEHYIATIYDYAMFRCLYGFFCGVITYIAMAKIRHRVIAPSWGFFFVEALTLLACFAFVRNTGMEPQSLLGPLVFSIAVAVFSFEKGWISILLKKPLFQFFGGLSYTLYISHAIVLNIIKGLFRVLQQKTGYFTIVKYYLGDDTVELFMPVSDWASNAVVVAILLFLVALCVLVNRWVEIPCRDYFGRVAKRFQRPNLLPQPVESEDDVLAESDILVVRP